MTDLEAFKTLDITTWCEICRNLYIANGCEGCSGLNCFFGRPDMNHYTPTKFEPCRKIRKENKKMIVTIIGSYRKTDEMMECKAYWERFGHQVNCPCDPERKNLPLIEKQSGWIKKIEEADLVVAIAKEVCLSGDGSSRHVYEFGESTSYEMAIALRNKKQIVIW